MCNQMSSQYVNSRVHHTTNCAGRHCRFWFKPKIDTIPPLRSPGAEPCNAGAASSIATAKTLQNTSWPARTFVVALPVEKSCPMINSCAEPGFIHHLSLSLSCPDTGRPLHHKHTHTEMSRPRSNFHLPVPTAGAGGKGSESGSHKLPSARAEEQAHGAPLPRQPGLRIPGKNL